MLHIRTSRLLCLGSLKRPLIFSSRIGEQFLGDQYWLNEHMASQASSDNFRPETCWSASRSVILVNLSLPLGED
jgi:hypothetical protein